jgi:hypothetical protein
VPVEGLSIGDLVLTAERGAAPIKWIGWQSFRRSPGRPWVTEVTPVVIRAHAVAPNLPERDLFLSRGHCVLVDAHLVPADFLVNGGSIAAAPVDQLDGLNYLHIELDSHEIIFAEGLPVETFAGGRGREEFSNFADYARLYGEDDPAMPLHPAAYGPGPALKGLALTLAAPLLGTEDPIRRAHRTLAERSLSLSESA